MAPTPLQTYLRHTLQVTHSHSGLYPCPHYCVAPLFVILPLSTASALTQGEMKANPWAFSFSTERIDASYFKAPLATSKSRQTTSEDAWALFVRLCRYADNEYSNQFNISFAIVDIKCAQNYNKFEAKGLKYRS